MSFRRPIRNLADIEAIEREMPLAQRISAASTYDILRQSAVRFADRIAVRFLPAGNADETPVDITYAQLFARVTQAANLFHSHGLRPGRAVSFLLPNLPQTHFTIWGGEAAGIVNAINPLLQPHQIVEILEAAESEQLVALGPVPGSDIWQKVAEVCRRYPKLRTVFVVGPQPAAGMLPEGVTVLDFDTELARQPADRLVSGRVIAPDEICSYFHTGGTTGSPKLAQHTHAGEVYMAWVMAEVADLTPDDVTLLGLPLFHVNAVIVSGLGPFYAGAQSVLLSPAGYRNPEVIRNFWKIVARYRATTFSGVPTIYAALLNVPQDGVDVSSLRFGICGAAPMPVELFRAFQQASGVKILEGYGLTEGTCASSFNPRDGESRIGSVGLRYPYEQMKCVKVDGNGRYVADCAPGEVGVVTIAGPNVFPGYRQQKFNAAAFVAPGWLNTGDLGREDADGYFWLVGRAKDLIIRGGHNIDPGQIEEVLHRHPAVALAAAIGKPDAYAGELPVAYVQLKPGQHADAEALREFARAHVPERPAAPVEVHVLPALPVTAVGKIFKPELRYDITARALAEALQPLAAEGIDCQVTAGAHDSHGLLARVTVATDGDAAAAEARVRKVLGAFAVRSEITLQARAAV